MKRLLRAACFAAEKHADQRRKDACGTPYINHPLAVAELLARVGDVVDEDVLIAALLHDTVEDTNTTRNEIVTHFGESVAILVMACTDDKSLPKSERKRLQVELAPHKPEGAKLIKLADKTCNLHSLIHDPPESWSQQRKLEYVDWAEQVIAGLIGANSALEKAAVDAIASCRNAFA